MSRNLTKWDRNRLVLLRDGLIEASVISIVALDEKGELL
jgi:hypothetical protein